jgi:hypothetical protein
MKIKCVRKKPVTKTSDFIVGKLNITSKLSKEDYCSSPHLNKLNSKNSKSCLLTKFFENITSEYLWFKV